MTQLQVAFVSDQATPPVVPIETHPPPPSLGQVLLKQGAVQPPDLLRALEIRKRHDLPLAEVLLAHGWVTETQLIAAQAELFSLSVVDLAAQPPDPRLIDALGAEHCLKDRILPWRRIAGVTLVATARPEEFARVAERLSALLGPCRMVLAAPSALDAAIFACRRTALIRRAETCVAPHESCRSLAGGRVSRAALGVLVALAIGLWLAPPIVYAALFGWTILTLIATVGLKLISWLAEMRAQARPAPPRVPVAKLPTISVMVPLFHETDIAPRLIARLERLDYPRERLDIVLVVEEADRMTQAALTQTPLPHWMRIVSVPEGPIKTKPRALNYALTLCRGSIIGVYDAEDMPDPAQLRLVAAHFAVADPKLACLQGMLDYYNPRTNWLSRCFTIEYAAWFRAMLPGLGRLGLVIPLGGTTLFFRREILEELGGWDAHNVTEDADLGLRLARHGYRTEVIPTVTHEEANCRALPWIRQRSRWLKGYAMTWAVHMRNPVRFWRELGAKRFIGIQILMLGGLSQYLLAPLLWSFWLMPFGIWHPVEALMSPAMIRALFVTFTVTEVIHIVVGIWALRRREHRFLIPWVPMLHFYFPLGALAGWKAIYEVVAKPFYWDKTAHGLYDAPQATRGRVNRAAGARSPRRA
ncbi:glycosyltransferase [Sinirhodobacter sp. WL0062]|uniref:Glycosyltransferase n=1 Tax=Rhodobacter flavimaris TaxID=2907145 RepID=A0ABS8YU58_9RHOB|nr:glycosyltransferase [Sinirhodobacter sp. WL0062]MCE5972630.1 glycosyltransferase [Sinirhodobacter sp. WL0062]